MGKPPDYWTAKQGLIRPADITEPYIMFQYFSQETGGTIPVGVKQRGLAIRRMKEEMAYQMWTFEHLVASIKYMKNRNIRAYNFDYVYWNVGKAVAAGYLGDNRLTVLDEQVAEAIYQETDPSWVRKLSLAKGRAREMVYAAWLKERGSALTV